MTSGMSKQNSEEHRIAQFLPVFFSNGDYLDDLAEKLLSCPAVRDDHTRSLIVAQLGSMGNAIDRFPSAKQDVVSILKTCRDYPDGIHQLIERVVFFDNGSNSLKTVIDKLWEMSFPRLKELNSNPDLRPALLELLVLVRNISTVNLQLKELFHQMRLNLQVSELPDSNDTVAWLRFFDDIPPQIGRDVPYPLIEFAVHIGHKIGGDTGERLTAQAKEIASILGFLPKMESFILSLTTSAQNAKWTYLLIVLTPSLYSDEKKYTLRFWLWGDGEQRRLDDFERDHELDMTAVPKELNRLIRSLEERYGPDLATPLRIEVFLPIDLLSSAVDEWPFELPLGAQSNIGAFHQIVVRSQERLYNRRLLSRWKTKWQTFLHYGCRLDPQTYRLFRQEHLQNSEVANRILPDEGVIGCSLAFVPNVEILKATLNGGIPIALWLRSEPIPPFPTTDGIPNELMTVFQIDSFEKLPEFVRRNRNSSTNELDIRLWKYVSLLWDDPARVPHEPTLKMP